VSGLSKRWQAVLGAGAASLGFYYGTGVSDLARVLRLPGTVNRKVPVDPRPCRILSNGGPRHALDELRSALDAAERWELASKDEILRLPGQSRVLHDRHRSNSAHVAWLEQAEPRVLDQRSAARTNGLEAGEILIQPGAGGAVGGLSCRAFVFMVAEDQSGEPRVGLPVIPSPRGWRHEAVRLQQGGINQKGDHATVRWES
jgi:hypothetical protein